MIKVNQINLNLRIVFGNCHGRSTQVFLELETPFDKLTKFINLIKHYLHQIYTM